MSQENVESENVEVVRALFEAWNLEDMGRLRALFDPAVIVRAPEGWPEPGPFIGAEAVMRQWSRMREAFEADSLRLTDDLLASGDRVLARLSWRATGHGPETDMEMTGLWTVRGGLVFHAEFFWDHAEALKAVGLAESALTDEAECNAAEAYEARPDDAEKDVPTVERALRKYEEEEAVEMIYDISAPHDLRVVLGKSSITTEEVDSFIHDADADPAVKLRLLEDVEPQGYGPQGAA